MKTVLILGASSDIGLHIINVYKKNNFRVIAHGNSSIDRLGNHAELTFKLDMSDIDEVQKYIFENWNMFANVDVIINCLGLLEPCGYHSVDALHLRRVFNINLFSPILFSKEIIPMMSKKKWGRVVHLGSIGVKYGGGPNSFSYSLSKHALEFMPSEHKKWAANNVLVNTLRVGVTDTRIHHIDITKDMSERVSLIPMGRMATPDEIAKEVYWMGSENNSHITGQVIAIAGGE